jgi:hypothetical protein
MLVTPVAQCARQHLSGVLLDEDATLEGEPRGHCRRGLPNVLSQHVGGDGALHDIPVCVASVAVRAAERAADVGVDRPEAHVGDFGSVEDALGADAHVSDVALLAEHGKLARGALVGVGKEGDLGESHGTEKRGNLCTEYIPKTQEAIGSIRRCPQVAAAA